VDAAHGDTLDAWKKMGSPALPTEAQIEALRKDSGVGAPEDVEVRDHRLTVTLPPMGLAVITISW
jgi:xylan 1,4-beta-xylosidase